MIHFLTIGSLYVTLVLSSHAQPAIQDLSRRADYQGGWPLALIGTASPSCPASASVSCSSKNLNPACCPSGQTCIFSGSNYANYCCPTDADCNTAVLNFPRCANSTWNMFIQSPSGYFCCEPGKIGVNPSDGLSGGLCEPASQPVPTSLLATVITQVGVATAAPSGSRGNATETGGGGTTQTNPSLSSTSSSSAHGSAVDGVNGWPLRTKLAVGIVILVALAVVLIIGCLVKRRRNRMLLYRYQTGVHSGQYDENGNLVPPSYSPFDPYSRRDGNGNNVTVNVVHGDQR